ncbi:hypothetical protein O6W96_16335 [Sphingomonas faeni]
MNYALNMIHADENGRQTVRGPRTADVIEYALRGAFDEPRYLPDDMMAMLHQIDRVRH